MSDRHDPHVGLRSEQGKPGPGRAGRSARAFALPTRRNGT